MYHRALLDIAKTHCFKSRTLTSFVKVSVSRLADEKKTIKHLDKFTVNGVSRSQVLALKMDRGHSALLRATAKVKVIIYRSRSERRGQGQHDSTLLDSSGELSRALRWLRLGERSCFWARF